jgi:hypothetical protein
MQILGIIDSQKTGKLTGYYDIATYNVSTSNISTISIDNIPSYYKVLQIRAYLRSSAAQTISGFQIRVNNNSDSNYMWQRFISNNTTAQQSALNSQSSWSFGSSSIPGNNASAGNYGTFVMTMTGYADNNDTYKSIVGYGGMSDVGAGANFALHGLFGGMYIGNKNDISSLQFVINDGNYAIGSYVHVYGVL